MWKYTTKEILRLQIEIGNYCNLECPSCARKSNRRLPLDTDWMSLSFIEKHIRKTSLPNLIDISICGNIEEPTINPEIESIIEYFCSNWPDADISISSNASTRNEKFWNRLGQISANHPKFQVVFAIDGLEDTNHLYRVGSSWEKILRNIRAYLSNPGAVAIWQFVEMPHNSHQIESVKEFAKSEGFKNVWLRTSGRVTKESVINVYTKKYHSQNETIVCRAQTKVRTNAPSIFVNYLGDVVPCCWLDPVNVSNYKAMIPWIEDCGGVLAYNLNYLPIEEIIEGEFFSIIQDNMNSNSVCNRSCRTNAVDHISPVEL